jgi:hypothetical protein
MVFKQTNFFTEDIINYICNLPDVIKAKEELESSSLSSKYFSIDITPEIQQILFDKLGLNLSNVPMRWIKGDTKPHIDSGKSKFNNTYLVYLTDSEGELLIEDESYPIQQNTSYMFSEGLKHETLNTGSVPRLLLGPMSEIGFAVGGASTITADGATDTIYFKLIDISVLYKINDGSYDSFSLPITIVNSNTSSTLKVLFENDIPISNSTFYFICGSDNIQFGSESLQNDGTRPIMTIDSITGYEGLIKNGDSFGNGYNNIYIYNLEINIIGGSTLTSNSGWFGREYFARGASDCYIVNCHSDGSIIDAGGGIVGGYAGTNNGNLQIIGCSSSGNSGQYSGGIVGYFAAQTGGNVTCTGCWSTGTIGIDGGGIFGYFAADEADSTVSAINCYSTGIIGDNGGGIFGRLTAAYGEAIAQNCYSTGNISTDAGGIFGSTAATDTGSTSAINCYSTGSITTSGNGIYGSNKGGDTTTTNCYSADGIWSSTTANTQLTGTPVSPSVIGTTWVATVTDQPYELLNMGYTPYTIDNISVSGGGVPSLVRTSSETIAISSSTSSAIISGKSYTILEKSGGDSGSYSTITINSTTGVISTTLSTDTGTYTLSIRNDGSYNITSFSLIVSGIIPPEPVPDTQKNNSFRVSNLLLDNVANSVSLAQGGSGGFGIHSNSLTIYDTLLLQLVNDALIEQ